MSYPLWSPFFSILPSKPRSRKCLATRGRPRLLGQVVYSVVYQVVYLRRITSPRAACALSATGLPATLPHKSLATCRRRIGGGQFDATGFIDAFREVTKTLVSMRRSSKEFLRLWPETVSRIERRGRGVPTRRLKAAIGTAAVLEVETTGLALATMKSSS